MSRAPAAWQRFVLAHGWHARGHVLAAVLGQPVADVEHVRRTRACTRLKTGKRFAELFSLWHGRAPNDVDWPTPWKGAAGVYEWQAPELALLASLVGRMGGAEISRILTTRLRLRTGDRRAKRSRNSVFVGMQRLGLQSTDTVGGITLEKAAKETGAYYNIWNAIKRGELRAFRVGRLWVIPHEAWESWKASRVFPPKGYVQLSTLKRPLGIRSDKLSEWARMGYVPSALRCNPFGTRAKLTKFGTWYIDAKVAKRLVADRRAGRPMPWWGKPEPYNLKVTWKLLQERLHPSTCRTCAQIWGPRGAPVTYQDYVMRYPPLAFGAKRHLTMIWSPGLTLTEVARHTGASVSTVKRAIDKGMLEAARAGRSLYVTKTDATRWKARKCPIGGNEKSWITLETARTQYLFTLTELRQFIAAGKLRSKVGTNGPMRGLTYVPRHQCAKLRETIGFSEGEAARRVGVSVHRLRTLLKGVDWRGADGIPLDTVHAVARRVYSQDEGYTLEQAAAKLGTTVAWIHERKLDGTIRIQRAKFDRRRIYVTAPMFERLKLAKAKPAKRERFTSAWLFLTQAANDAGVSTGSILKWVAAGELVRRHSYLGWRYFRKSLRARARRYWETVRYHRAVPPDWLQRERVKPAANEEPAALRLVA